MSATSRTPKCERHYQERAGKVVLNGFQIRDLLNCSDVESINKLLGDHATEPFTVRKECEACVRCALAELHYRGSVLQGRGKRLGNGSDGGVRQAHRDKKRSCGLDASYVVGRARIERLFFSVGLLSFVCCFNTILQ